MEFADLTRLVHPVFAVVVVFPLIGMVINRAWLTRSRRLQTTRGHGSNIPSAVGPEHLALGRWLTGTVVGVALLGIGHPISKNILNQRLWEKTPLQVALIGLLFAATIGSMICLYRSRQKHWRAIFATLTGMGLVILGSQDGVFRRTNEWYVSHYYYGIAVVLLMVFSLAIVQDIYQDRSQRWRRVHIVLNCIALLLFIGQGLTGTRDLLEIPLSWQESHIYQCNFENRTCPEPSSPTQ